MVTPAEALQLILDRVNPLAPVRQPLSEVLGLAVSEALHSAAQVPPFTNSAMDGYAVRSEDLLTTTAERPIRLRVLGDLAAGGVSDAVVHPGEALRIMTGAILPEGADAVVPVEDTSRG